MFLIVLRMVIKGWRKGVRKFVFCGSGVKLVDVLRLRIVFVIRILKVMFWKC